MKSKKFILWFDELGIEDVPLVGGKNASLGEMYCKLTKKGISIPNGFAITAAAYKYLIIKAGIEKQLKETLKGLKIHNVSDLMEKGTKARSLILNARFPELLKLEIIKAYRKLCAEYGKNTDVAVRSSATAEDLPTASFAGQQETYLNIRGEKSLLLACRKCFASLFTNRAISYREDKGFDHFKVYLSIGVQKMVRSDLACSGVMFSIDTESGFSDVVFINGSYGLGENVVQGKVNPDAYYIFKPTLKKGYNAIISKLIGSKMIKMVYTINRRNPTKNIRVKDKERKKFVLNDKEIMQLAKWAVIIEDHYKKPMDMEWAKDGITNKLFILQARPETVKSQEDKTVLKEYYLKQKGAALVEGRSVGSKIGQGKVHIIKRMKDLKKFKKGEVLITGMTNPDMEPVMKIANGIVTDKGGRTCFGGNTKVLTNHGFYNIKELCDSFNQQEELSVLSLDNKTGKVIWRPIVAVTKRRAPLWKIQISPTLRSKQNFLEVTPDHKFFTLKNCDIIKKDIKNLIRGNEGALVADKIPQWGNRFLSENKSYLFGALLADGFLMKNKQGGYVVGFVQKIVPEKKRFINAVCSLFKESYNKNLRLVLDKRGDIGSYNCYSKIVYEEMTEVKNKIVEIVLSMDEPHLLHFLAGIIDSDGNLSDHQIQITVSEKNKELFEAIIISSYRIGIIPSICKRKSWYIISFNEDINKILMFTRRVKGDITRTASIKRFLAKQILSDVVTQVNKKGRIKHGYIIRNRMISGSKIERDIIPKVTNKADFKKLLNSDFYMSRVGFEEKLGENEVYNITVAASKEINHNYVVFTSNYTPVIVSNCHAAIISRELGIPCIVGTNNATRKIKTGQKITVSCAEGDTGIVYDGLLKFGIKKYDLKKIPKTKTKVMMNIGVPAQALEQSFIPNDGVGLAREEFIINSYIKIHPKALINFDKIKDKKIKRKIEELTFGFEDKKEFFISKLAWGIAMIAAAFYPKDVIVRTSDFKTNEYANLIGGKEYEPEEGNPMIGWRGASRYYSNGYADAFALECKALKRVREEMGLTNVKIMIPFCRTVEEGKKVLAEMEKHGLKRGKNGLEVYVMCEIPSNVILGDEFLKIFDGFSIGTNDLTQLTLGLDRDSELVSSIYDERNEAVKKMVAEIIRTARKNKKKIGICGQAPSDYAEFAQFLVKCGIDSISLNPDTVVRTTLKIAEMEKRLKKTHT